MFLREWTFFLTKRGDESYFFLENERFLTKYGHKSSIFFVRNRKKRASYWLFWPIIECSFDRIYVFLTKFGHESSGFFVKSRKKGHPIDFFGPSYSVVLTELTSFDQIWACQQMVFHEKFEKKWDEITVFWEIGRFFYKLWAWVCFLENRRISDEIWACE